MQSPDSPATALPPSTSWGAIERFRNNFELADKNADPGNWEWKKGRMEQWTHADEEWQDFKENWYGQQPPLNGSLSLKPLSMPYIPFDSPDSTILVRDSYNDMFDIVWARAMSSDGKIGVIITGQPGIGKTTFLFYLLVRLLQRKQIVLFSLNGVDLFLFSHDHVSRSVVANGLDPGLPRRKLSSSNVFIWSLFDMEKATGPRQSLVWPPCFPVQTASPNRDRFKIWAKERGPLITGLPLWTRDELALGLPFQEQYPELLSALDGIYSGRHINQYNRLAVFNGAVEVLQEYTDAPLSSNGALHYLLQAAIEKFGYSARDVFNAVFAYKKTTKEHENSFEITYDKLLENVKALAICETSHDSIKDWILSVSPIHDPESPFEPVTWSVKFKSKWVARSVVRQLDDAEVFEMRQRVCRLQAIPQAKALARWFLEPVIHRTIAEIALGGDLWPLIKMTSNSNNSPTYTRTQSKPSPGIRFAKMKREIIKLESIVDLSAHLQNNGYYVLTSPNFPLFDAFVIDIDRSQKSAVLWILQITTSRTHGGSSATGYEKIRAIIRTLKDALGTEPPPKKHKRGNGQAISSSPVEVRYLLVVPDVESQVLRWRFPAGWKQRCDPDDHRGDVYCLEIPISVHGGAAV